MSSVATYTSRTLRAIRIALILSVLTVPISLAAISLLSRSGLWWIAQWVGVVLYVAIVISVIAGILKIAHSIWIMARFPVGELLITFIAAGGASVFAVGWVRTVLRFGRTDRDAFILGVVLLTFVLFVSGSAWAWGIFSRAPDYPWRRKLVLVCGWISSVGVLCLTSVLFLSILLISKGQLPVDSPRNIYKFGVVGIVLAAPGFVIERMARRHLNRE